MSPTGRTHRTRSCRRPACSHLTPSGRRDAQLVADRPQGRHAPRDRITASDLVRCAGTAQILGSALHIPATTPPAPSRDRLRAAEGDRSVYVCDRGIDPKRLVTLRVPAGNVDSGRSTIAHTWGIQFSNSVVVQKH
ncbi:histidine phosphatase family protein [Nocardia jiangxiensis]|uniref:Histidine phosphatase family protein n=1 Tax=Nocardia jiangxiensis TaxID=282685 RepID=A0ABW6S3L3_9NOCA